MCHYDNAKADQSKAPCTFNRQHNRKKHCSLCTFCTLFKSCPCIIRHGMYSKSFGPTQNHPEGLTDCLIFWHQLQIVVFKMCRERKESNLRTTVQSRREMARLKNINFNKLFRTIAGDIACSHHFIFLYRLGQAATEDDPHNLNEANDNSGHAHIHNLLLELLKQGINTA